MVAIRATFDGTSITLPADVRGRRPGNVMVIFYDEGEAELQLGIPQASHDQAAMPIDGDDEVFDHL